MVKHNWFIGTSGFMISQKNWLDQKQLNCIEINSSFYRTPGETQIKNWLKFPKDIYFCLKVNKYITHSKKLKDIDEIWDNFWDKVKPLGKKLKCLLFQMSPSFVCNELNLKRLNKLYKKIKKIKCNIVFEFRDISWFNDEIYELFSKFNWTISSTYIKKTKESGWLNNMPNGFNIVPKTSNVSYMRIHGARGYRGEMKKKQLAEMLNKIKDIKCKENYVFFNNVFFTDRSEYCVYNKTKIKYSAVCNAVEFSNMTK